MKLNTYHKQRNFKRTPEPEGKVAHNAKFLYVIQKHDARHLHYDFRLELNGVLLSWAIPKGPSLDPKVKRLAIHVEDHPIDYGHFEGVIPKGEYGAGTVIIWDKGTWLPLDDDPTAAYRKGHLRFILKAKKLNGEWHLIKFKKENDKSWFLIKAQDEFAKSNKKSDFLEEASNIYPEKIYPQLATLVDKVPSSKAWLHELKFDGYRILAFKKESTVKLISRNQNDWTDKFKKISQELQKLPVEKIIFDGEIVLLDNEQKSNFQLLQNSIGKNCPFKYYIFDLLYYDNHNLFSLPLIERKKILKQVLDSINSSHLLFSDHIIGSGSRVFRNACKMGLEGIVSKKTTSIYEEKRSQAWLKMRCMHRQEFVIGGYTPPRGSREYFGSLLLGYYDNNHQLKFCGHVGTGFTQHSLKTLYTALKKIVTKNSPFASRPPGQAKAVWVNPELVAEIEFSEWTTKGILRHPSFKGLRSDKPANSIIKESEIPLNDIQLPIKFTHPEKILYPESKITKIALANYYNKIQKWILPYLVNRPLTLVRCPKNYKNCFYQKHISGTSLSTIKIKEKNKTEDYVYIKDAEELMALIQMSVLEIHPWGSRIEKIEYPDMITFDLDPDSEVPWKQVTLMAKKIRQHLLDFKLKSFVKSTGGKGLHVVVPILPEYDWEQIKNFTHIFVAFMVKKYPKECIGEMSKSKRKGKIFIDYLRNQRGATAISVYSTRARPHAPVSAPLAWKELTHNREETSFDIFSLPKRLENLARDPWKDFFKIKQSLKLDQLKKNNFNR